MPDPYAEVIIRTAINRVTGGRHRVSGRANVNAAALSSATQLTISDVRASGGGGAPTLFTIGTSAIGGADTIA